MIIEIRAWDKTNKKMIYTSPYSSFHKHITWTGHCYDKGKLLDYDIMLWTTCYDKNKKKIFEGDIVKNRDATGEVIYFRDSFLVNKKHMLYPIWNECEVIGNKYELEEKKCQKK